jgi:WD40 repeat protein/uncharacterized caspase-like protein
MIFSCGLQEPGTWRGGTVRQKAVLIAALFVAGNAPLLSAQNSKEQTGANKPELVVQAGHSLIVTAVAFSPDGRLLVSGGNVGEVNLWEASTGRMLRKIAAHTNAVNQLAFARDGQSFVTGTFKGEYKSWDVRSGKQRQVLEVPAIQNIGLALSGDGRWVAGQDQSSGAIVIWEFPSGHPTGSIKPVVPLLTTDDKGAHEDGPSMNLFQMAFSPDGRFLAGVDVNQKIFLYEVPAARLVRSWFADPALEAKASDPATKGVTMLAFSRDGAWLASAARDGNITVWDASSGKKIVGMNCGAPVMVMTFSADHLRLLTAGNGISDSRKPQIWELPSGKPAVEVKVGIDAGGTHSAAFTPDGKMLAVGGSIGNLGVFDAKQGDELMNMDGRGVTWWMAFQGGGKGLLMLSPEGGLTRWDLGQGIPVSPARSPEIGDYAQGAALNAAGTRIALAGSQLQIKELATGKQLAGWFASRSQVLIGFTPDSAALYSVDSIGSTVHIWDTTTGKEIRSAQPCGDRERLVMLLSAAISPDGRWLAGICHNELPAYHFVGLWDTQSWKLSKPSIEADPASRTVAFTPDGKMLAIGSDAKPIQLVRVDGGEAAGTFPGEISAGQALRFSADGKWLAAGGSDGFELWEAETRKLVAMYSSVPYVREVEFTPDSRILATIGWDGRISLWDPSAGAPLASLSLWGSDWLVATPDGRFDGSPGGWKKVLWRFNNNTLDYLPVEAFFKEFYTPGLLAKVASGQPLLPVPDLERIDRRQPLVRIISAGDAVNASARGLTSVDLQLAVQEAPPDSARPRSGSGVRDVRLFRNGNLVQVWRGAIPLDKKGGAHLAISNVRLVDGKNFFTAYAFSRANIKSEDAAPVTVETYALATRGVAYVLSVGINQYKSSDLNLQYASDDASAFSNTLSSQESRLEDLFYKVVTVPVLNEQATKANIISALARLAGTETGPIMPGQPAGFQNLQPATPRDSIFIYYAGHGAASAETPRFYLWVHDFALDQFNGDEASLLKLPGVISDLELERSLEKIDAREIVLVLDACHSGKSLQMEDPRQGPMNSQGLAQLAYEKGMYILAAAEGNQLAQELDKYQHGLLTYALVVEGLEKFQADDAPHDGQISLREWFDYASERVAQLQQEGSEVATSKRAAIQEPRAFYRRDPEVHPVIVAKVGSSASTARP